MAVVSRARRHRYRLTTPGRPVVRAPAPDVLLATVESLPRDGHAVLQSLDEPEVYVQAWFRPDGTYQLELRDGSVAMHRQTRTVDRGRVAAAFTAWLDEHTGDGDAGWRDGFDWTDISATFDDDPPAP